jgi:hypothetical protein
VQNTFTSGNAGMKHLNNWDRLVHL